MPAMSPAGPAGWPGGRAIHHSVAARIREQPARDQLVSKRLFWDVFKYVLAGGLLSYVVWSHWGYPDRVAGRIVLAPKPDATESDEPPTIVGRVAAYAPNQSILIDASSPADPSVQGLDFLIVAKKTKFDERSSEIQHGSSVAVWEHPGRGLAYVWRHPVA